MRLSLDNGADVNKANEKEKGQTSLQATGYQGNVDAARLLLDKGAKIEQATQEGTTPLHFACKYGNVDVTRLLLEKGADLACFCQKENNIDVVQ